MYKQAIVIRSDLKMGKGKMAAQAAHASVEAISKADEKNLEAWKKTGQKKVVLKVGSEKDLITLKEKCKKEKIPCALISDAGHTQLEPGTTTALGIGPDKEEKIDKITGKLKLM